jgi:hypothetical protein
MNVSMSNNELVSPAEDEFYPVPTDFQLALAPQPMRVDPMTFAVVDHGGAL